ncbi:MAG: nitric-oxide reductase large subunit [Legionella sp.]|nr:nitric-oxide reductase large subunit [Legionella sp.]
MRYNEMYSIKRLWVVFGASMLIMFAILLAFGSEIYQKAPPIPKEVVLPSGHVVMTSTDIEKGQNVWQSLGGMEQGSIWGHGSYLAPDWSALWLHEEAMALLNIYAKKKYHNTYDNLGIEAQAALQAKLQISMRKNKYDPSTGKLLVDEDRLRAIHSVSAYFSNIFQSKDDAYFKDLREKFAFPEHVQVNNQNMQALNAFFFWTAWAAGTERPNSDITYTSNWPHEPLIGNDATAGVFVWSILSIFVLLGGIGFLVWYYVKQYDAWREDLIPDGGVKQEDPLKKMTLTPSMRATKKYFFTVTLLILAQVILGVITAHYAVSGQDFYGIPLSEYLPYSVSRTWHTQLAVFWIATAWLSTGLYMAPLISGYEPKFQRLGVNFLFLSLLTIVVGSLIGEWLGINQFFKDLSLNFWFGHQGYEYLDLGRFWQIFLFIGLVLWFFLVVRALKPAFKNAESKSLLFLLLIASGAIALLYAAGFMWGQHVNISIMEYWRWWVVHLWVEGVFEVFATAVIAVLFVKMGLIRASTATTVLFIATIIFLSSGVLGMLHHLYWSGTPIAVMAVGSIFSALEVVPLIVIGFEAYQQAKMEKQALWTHHYYWPLMFFAAVLFWNFVGAGLLGFLINPPISLYYVQGLNTTAAHAHAALFGVYGMLGIGLMLFCLRGMTNGKLWESYLPKISFWCLNIGLAMMVFMSILPEGIWQAYKSYQVGYWYARSPEFLHTSFVEGLVWARVPGDLVFTVGVVCLAFFVLKILGCFNVFRKKTC